MVRRCLWYLWIGLMVVVWGVGCTALRPAYTPTPFPLPDPEPTLSPVPSYEGVIPGQTTREELLTRLGAPYLLFKGETGETLSYYTESVNSPWTGPRPSFQIRDGVVMHFSVLTPGTNLEQAIQMYGIPGLVIIYENAPMEGMHTTDLIYSTQGVAVFVYNYQSESLFDKTWPVGGIVYDVPESYRSYAEQQGEIGSGTHWITWPGFDN